MAKPKTAAASAATHSAHGAHSASGGLQNDNFTNPADYRRHDNKFLNRKMLIYNIISQIEESPKKNRTPEEPYGTPKRTFELFHMMKNITQKFCPNEYVNSDWIELAVNLFYILHKGNVFRYEETLSDEEFGWIKSILTTCLSTVETIELVSRPDNGDEGAAAPSVLANSNTLQCGGKVIL